MSLIAVYLVAAAHVIHWRMTGQTLTPVEPSEAMQTLGQGLVNAGFVLFAILIVGTLIFGRFFCGWACHIVALQDLCTHILRTLGVKPRPFRSRLLVYVPILSAIWMFVMPSVVRLVLGQQHPVFRAAFFTENLWGRFPGPWVACLTFFVCGFLIVYLLGNKGFCTYGCPYGGVFGLVDTYAPGKIRVSDACDGCGHCTATCTSNVRVHEEVKLYRMVVDPGCMKCMDCIDVCPKGALSYGFGNPSVAKGPKLVRLPERPYDFSLAEELAMAGIFLVSVVILRALYDAVPFLLALGLASISAYTLLTAARMFYVQNLRYSRYQLMANGRPTRSGSVFLLAAALWTLFLGHSSVVQYCTIQGSRLFEAARSAAATDPERPQALADGLALLNRAERLGLVPSGALETRIASASQAAGDDAAAERHYRRAVALSSDLASAHLELARYARARGEKKAAIDELTEAVRLEPTLEGAHDDLAGLLLEEGRANDALTLTDRLIARRPGVPAFRLTHALVLGQMGNVDGAIHETQEVAGANPNLAAASYQLGRLLASQSRMDEALVALERAAELDPKAVEVQSWCAKVALSLSKWSVARAHLAAAMREAPFDRAIVRAWAAMVRRAGDLDRAIADAETSAVQDRANRFARMYLYREAGRDSEAEGLAAEFPDSAR
jgi:polyferredoxin/Flp pilus assembly protein TadD